VVLFAAGGQASLPLGALVATMMGWHTLIGIGEAMITGLTVSAVVAVRPDLMYAARGLRSSLRLRRADGSTVEVPAPAPAVTPDARSVLIGAGLVAVGVAGVLSFVASTQPDGLEYVAGTLGFLQNARDHLFAALPLADYGAVAGIPVGVAGIVGLLVTALLGSLVFRAVGRRPGRAGSRSAPR
ncbi:MAG: PDGLE domain-containing protein, partial [Jiangellaceae bacterium]|nr:PDGLE domain-containing protein [Jiangellaceae bacterium]